jgi:hypothetical protein
MLNSDVPLGWAVPRGYVCSISIPWGDRPKFVLPTPMQGTVRVMKATMTLTVGFYVHSEVG